MAKLKDKEKRGRPDIVHFSLLEAMGSPLNLEGQLSVYVHTINDQVVSLSPITRLPRNYNRFLGLMEQLFQNRKLPNESENLLQLSSGKVSTVLHEHNCSYVVALSRSGTPLTPTQLATTLMTHKNPAVLIGGFPKGKLSSTTLRNAKDCVSIDPASLDTWIVVSRVITAVEQVLRISDRRLAQSKLSK